MPMYILLINFLGYNFQNEKAASKFICILKVLIYVAKLPFKILHPFVIFESVYHCYIPPLMILKN